MRHRLSARLEVLEAARQLMTPRRLVAAGVGIGAGLLASAATAFAADPTQLSASATATVPVTVQAATHLLRSASTKAASASRRKSDSVYSAIRKSDIGNRAR